MQASLPLRPPTISELKLTSVNLDYQLGQIIVFSRILRDLGLVRFVYHRKTMFPVKAARCELEGIKKRVDGVRGRFGSDKRFVDAFQDYCGFSEREKKVMRDCFGYFSSKNALTNYRKGGCGDFDKGVDEFFGVYERIREAVEGFVGLRRVYVAFDELERRIDDFEQLPSEYPDSVFGVWSKLDLLKNGSFDDSFSIPAYFHELLEWLVDEGVHTMSFLQSKVGDFLANCPAITPVRKVFSESVVDEFEAKHDCTLPECVWELKGFLGEFYSPGNLERILGESGVKIREGNVSRKNYELRLELQKIARAEQKIKVLEMVLGGTNIHNRARNEASLKKVRDTLLKAQKKVELLTKAGAVSNNRIDDQSCYLSFCAFTTSYKLCRAVVKMIKDAMDNTHDASQYSYDFIPGVNERCSRFIVSFPKNSKLYGVMKCRGEGFLKSLLAIVRLEIEKSHGNRLRFCKLIPLETF